MSATKPLQGVVLYDADANAMYVEDGVAVPANTKAVLLAGQDPSGTARAQRETALDSGNSSTSQLGNGGTFVGTGVDCLGYSSVAVTVHSDEDSAVDGMTFQFSLDNTNWDDSYAWTLDASSSTTRRFQFPVTARYFRVNYTNGITTTTAFRCQTILHRQNILTSVHRLADNASADRSAQVMKAAVIAQRAGGASTDFIPVEADLGGNLKTVLGDSIPAGTNNIGDVDVVSSALPTGAATEAKQDTIIGHVDGVEGLLTSIKDTDGIKKITDALPTGDNTVGRVKVTDGTDVLEIDSGGRIAVTGAGATGAAPVGSPVYVAGWDGTYIRALKTDDLGRLKIVQVPPEPPAGTTVVQIAADTPLDVSSSHDTEYLITNGVTFYLQQVVSGGEGDPSERGSKVEVIYYDGTTEHIVERFYVPGFTLSFNFSDQGAARDGTAMVGDGATKKIIVRRDRLGGGTLEVDTVVFGYEQ